MADNTHTKWVEERTKPPFLRRICISGYKSIAYCDVALQPLTVLVGKNGSGKSNFLDALALLQKTMDENISKVVNDRGGWPTLICRTSDQKRITFDIDVHFVCGHPHYRNNDGFLQPPANGLPDVKDRTFAARYQIEIAADEKGNPSISRENLHVNDESGEIDFGFEVEDGIVTRSNNKSGAGADLSFLTSLKLLEKFRPDRPLLSLIGFQPFIDVADGLRAMRCYNFHPDTIREPQKRRVGFLMRDGRNLAFAIEGLKEIDPNQLWRVREYVSLITPEVVTFDRVPVGEYETVQFRLRTSPEKPNLEFDAASMSDGTLRALAALMAAFQITLPLGHPSVVAIEEPETSLHPAATSVLIHALQEATENTQILLETHSAELLADPELEPSQLLVVRSKNGQTQIAPIDAGSREIIRQELSTPADLQRMDQLEPDESDLERQAQTRMAIAKG